MISEMWSKPRDPARIPRMLEKLALLWESEPDLRLGQIIVNLTGSPNPFYVEDDRLESAIDAELDRKTKPKG